MYSEERASQIRKLYSHQLAEIHEMYWAGKEVVLGSSSAPETKMFYIHKAKDIADKFNIPNVYMLYFLLKDRLGPYLGKCEICAKERYAQNRTEHQANFSHPFIKCAHHYGSAYTKQTNVAQFPVKIKQEQRIIDGAYIKARYVKSNQVTSSYYHIKLSEIKQIEDISEGCVFNTYKDCVYYVPMSGDKLIKAINLFLFKPNEFSEIHSS
jgi:hypothetical protein